MAKQPAKATTPWLVVALSVLIALGAWSLTNGLETTNDAETSSGDVAPSVQAQSFSNLPTVDVADLPAEAADTLALIRTDGPYPFDRDGLTFQNREGILPDEPRGHYREFTVITPGENDRGARRIVAGAQGERYYTADHYQSFHEIVQSP